MKHIEFAEILYNEEIFEGIYEMHILAPLAAEEARPGQFMNVYTGAGEYILPRPLSISEIDRAGGALTIIYQTVGKGTQLLSALERGAEVNVIGPLGNGFEIPQGVDEHIVVGGGIGAPPLVELVKNLKGKVTVFLGFRSAPMLVERFEELGARVHIATDDGCVGFRGNVVELMNSVEPKGGMIYACGPRIMLKNLSQWAAKRNMAAQVSMEERMACGLGACVGCAVKIKRGSEWQHLKVCKDGPVFWGSEVVWDD